MGNRTARAAGNASVVEVRNLVKTYNDRRVVDGVSFTVSRGEIFGVLGGNGAGKTTTVECAQGLRRPDAGTVHVLGLDPLRDRAELRGRVGSQLQDSNLPDRLRVGEAVRLFADDPRQAAATVDEWELGPLERQAFGDLSGGQRQRLFLALALLNRPEVVFLDELTEGLDPSARRAVWKLIERVRDRGTTVVLVTHFMEEAEVLCDRVAVVSAGQVIDTGTPHELIDRHGDGVRIRFENPGESLDRFRTLPGVVAVKDVGGDLEVLGAPESIAHIGAALVEHVADPPAMRIREPNLEDALLSILDAEGVAA